MAKTQKTAVTPTRSEDYPQWYQNVIKVSDLAENSEVRGCMVIKPWGYAVWENIQRILDEMFKETGHKNAYFPLFIPKAYFEKEAEHVEGFAKECAVVTHSRLEEDGKGGLKPAGELTEPMIVRPTSETIIGSSFAKWINSYRDLPLLINQWANVVRWELRTRLFLRTSEFLWQEGHTAHETKEEAAEETVKMLNVYADFAENYLAVPVLKGVKSKSETFPGAINTYAIEAMMQDKKALQAGTSHFLGQNFSRASNIKFQSREGKEEFAWTTSWGVSTRLIGALIMAHSDDNGLVLPPKIAPAHVAIIPIYKNEEQKKQILEFVNNLKSELKTLYYCGRKLIVEIDDRELTGSERSWSWIKKGIPVRLEVGPRDMAKDSVFMGRRDKEPKDKCGITTTEFKENIINILDEIQNNIFAKALAFREENTVKIDDKDEFYAYFTAKNQKKPEIHGGFALSHWCGSAECEEKIKNDLKVTTRVIPENTEKETGKCLFCGKESEGRVIFAKSY
ncbi:MAG: proline--tRNA ligase [Candidatus Cloacimonadota bacterium]|nr:MAG: proline--tRNA ligase [Candidatus Cloacimonadota bacterium]